MIKRRQERLILLVFELLLPAYFYSRSEFTPQPKKKKRKRRKTEGDKCRMKMLQLNPQTRAFNSLRKPIFFLSSYRRDF